MSLLSYNTIKTFSLVAFALAFLMFSSSVFAAGINPSCPSVYGATCPSGQLFVDKKVRNPQSGEFVESLSANDPTFLPDQEVGFRIEVKNTGSSDLDNIQVQDKLPDFVEFVSGPGNFDQNSKALNFSIDKLKAGEFKIFELKVKILSGKSLPAEGVTCLTNFAQAQKDQQVVQDSSVFCVQTQILGEIKELPKTGTKEAVLITLTSLGFLLISLILNKVKKGGEY